VCEGADSVFIKTYDGRTYGIKGIIGADSLLDIIILAVHIPADSFRCVRLSATLPAEGEPILVISSPLGLGSGGGDGA
jgi:S1-C subfamily serine protease